MKEIFKVPTDFCDSHQKDELLKSFKSSIEQKTPVEFKGTGFLDYDKLKATLDAHCIKRDADAEKKRADIIERNSKAVKLAPNKNPKL